MPRLTLPSKLPELDVVSAWLSELSQVLSAIAKKNKSELGSVVASLREENNRLKAELCGLRHLPRQDAPIPLSQKSCLSPNSKDRGKKLGPATDEETALGPLDAVEQGPTEHGPRPFLVTKPRLFSGLPSRPSAGESYTPDIDANNEKGTIIVASNYSPELGSTLGAQASNYSPALGPTLRLSFNDAHDEVFTSLPAGYASRGEELANEDAEGNVALETGVSNSLCNSRNISEPTDPSSLSELARVSGLDRAEIASAASVQSRSSASVAYSVASYTHTQSAEGEPVNSAGPSKSMFSRNSKFDGDRSGTSISGGERKVELIEMWPVWAANRQGRRAIYGATSGMRRIGVQIAGLAQGINASDRSMTSLISEPWIQGFILRPSSMRRFVWDVFGGFLISYDLIMVPLTQFELPTNLFFDVISWLITIFWTCDILRQFFIGYEDKGKEEMRPSRIARRYLSTWFIPDFVVVLIDWLCVIFDVNAKHNARSWHISKAIRALRILRTLRLVRAFKILVLFQRVKDRLQSEYVILATKAFYIVAAVLLITHYMACYWYAVGLISGSELHTSWLDVHELRHLDMGGYYTICLHWALGQAGLSTLDIRATSALERLYATGCMLVWLSAWIVAASFFSNSLMQVRDAHRAALMEEANIRKFLGAHSVSGDLTNAILAFCRNNYSVLTKQIFEDDIETFHHIPENLRVEMHMETYFPALRSHMVFSLFFKINPLTTRYICHLAMSEHHSDAGQELCQEGKDADRVYHICSGEFTYHVSGEECGPRTVRPGKWVGEVALWRKWVYNGCLLARAPSIYVEIHAQTFHAIMEEADAQGWAIEPLRRYAKLITVYYHEADPNADIWDNFEKIDELANQAFKSWDGWTKMEQSWKAWAFQNSVSTAATRLYSANDNDINSFRRQSSPLSVQVSR